MKPTATTGFIAVRMENPALEIEDFEQLVAQYRTRVLRFVFASVRDMDLAETLTQGYTEIQNSTITSFLKFIARRYKASPVRILLKAITVPVSEKCPVCQAEMKESNRVENRGSNFVRVFWHCPQCKKAKWETYGTPQQRDESGGRSGMEPIKGTPQISRLYANLKWVILQPESEPLEW